MHVVRKAQTSDESSGLRSSSKGTRAAELVEYDEITLPNNADKASTQPANANNIHLTQNSAYNSTSSKFFCIIMYLAAITYFILTVEQGRSMKF